VKKYKAGGEKSEAWRRGGAVMASKIWWCGAVAVKKRKM
jgi:hypothetical protein